MANNWILLKNAAKEAVFPQIDLGNIRENTLLDLNKVNGLSAALDAKLAITDFNNTIKDYATTAAVNAAIAASQHLKKEIVTSTSAMTAVDVIYLLAKAETDPGYVEGENIYDEYMVIDGKAEKIGNTKVDLKDYSTTTQVESLISAAKTEITGGSTKDIATLAGEVADKADKTYVDGIVGTNGELTQRVTATEAVANAAATKAYVDGTFKNTITGDSTKTIADIEAALSGLLSAGAVQSALNGKADKATTLAGYGITDAYTKTEANNLLANKADSDDVYTKTVADTTFVKAVEGLSAVYYTTL